VQLFVFILNICNSKHLESLRLVRQKIRLGETDRNPSTGEGTKRKERKKKEKKKKKGKKKGEKKSQTASRIRPVGLAFTQSIVMRKRVRLKLYKIALLHFRLLYPLLDSAQKAK